VDISVVIPTRGRADKLAACLDSLARQDLPGERFEVLVGFDGPDAHAEARARVAWRDAGGRPDSLVLKPLPRMGYQAVRNALLPLARGRFLLSTNDDVIADRGFVRVHAREQERAGRCVVISGSSPWRVHEPDRLFDRLVRETSMVFFFDRMNDADPARDWGFRHAWGLNMSMPTEAVRAVGGFVVLRGRYGYEDCELAYALGVRYGSPVLYRPEARVVHDHRLEPDEYLRREYRLGYAAPSLARLRPECAAALFGRDILSRDEQEYARLYLDRERRACAAARDAFVELARLPASMLDTPAGSALRTLLYQQHLPLKRWMWRRGLADSIAGRACNPDAALHALADDARPAPRLLSA
jgi:GT2 family glycosyltransferase